MHRIIPLCLLVGAASKMIRLRFPRVEIPSFMHGKDIGTRRGSNRWVRNMEKDFFFMISSQLLHSLFNVACIPSVSCVQGNLHLAQEQRIFGNFIKFVIVAG